MADIAVFGTAAADVVVQVPRLPAPGDHLSATSLGWRLGGGSANVGSALVAAGHQVELVGPIGDDAMGDALLAEIKRHGIGTARTFRVDQPTPRALILLDSDGERTILGFDRGFTEDVYPLTETPAAGDPDAVFVETYARYPTAIAEQLPRAQLFVPPPAAAVTHWPADVLVGSERQFPAAWGSAPYDAARAIAGPRLQWVVVTRGSRGADAYGPERSVHVGARPARQVDATGAGDAFAAGLMSGLLSGGSIEDAMRVAAEAGAAAVEVFQSVSTSSVEALGVRWPGAGR